MPDVQTPTPNWGEVFKIIGNIIQQGMSGVDSSLESHHIDPVFQGSTKYGGTQPYRSAGPTGMGPQPSADFGPSGQVQPKPSGSELSIYDLINQAQNIQPAHDAVAAAATLPHAVSAFLMAMKSPEDLAKLMQVVGRNLQP